VSACTLSVTQTHDFISHVLQATVFGNGFTSVTYWKSLDDVGSIEGFWNWMIEVTPQYLYQYTSFNGSEFEQDFQGTKWRILQYNLVVQRPRLRQIRIHREDCEVPRRMSTGAAYGGLLADSDTNGTNFKSADGRGDCYPSMNSAAIDKSGHWNLALINRTLVKKAMAYRTGRELKSFPFTARKSATPTTYEGGGYVQEFPLGLSNAEYKSMLIELKTKGWTDRSTRCILFDTAMYNLELNTFLNIRIAFEFEPHGFVSTYISKRATRMGFVRLRDVILFGLDVFVYCFVLANILVLMRRALRLGPKFFTYIPNTVDVINYSFFLIPLYFKVHFYLLTAPYIRSTGVAGNEHQIQNSTNSSFSSPQELHDSPTAKKNGSNLTNGSNFTNVSIVVGNQRQMPYYGDGLEDDFLDLDYAGWVFNMIALLNGFNSLFTWLKLFSYLQFLSKHAQHFIRTISIAAVNLGMMVALCTLILWAYAQTVFVSFGTDIPE